MKYNEYIKIEEGYTIRDYLNELIIKNKVMNLWVSFYFKAEGITRAFRSENLMPFCEEVEAYNYKVKAEWMRFSEYEGSCIEFEIGIKGDWDWSEKG